MMMGMIAKASLIISLKFIKIMTSHFENAVLYL